jgi:hypothetical protein
VSLGCAGRERKEPRNITVKASSPGGHKKKEGCFAALFELLTFASICGSIQDEWAPRIEAAEAEVSMASHGLSARAAAEILSVCPEREPAVAPLSVAEAGTHERAAIRLPRVPAEAL